MDNSHTMTKPTYSPLPLDVQAGKMYAFCQCGLSGDLPLCDNSHQGQSDKKAYKFIAEETGTLYGCVCSKTQTPPFCDGSQHCDRAV